jgi:hypothetical protein
MQLCVGPQRIFRLCGFINNYDLIFKFVTGCCIPKNSKFDVFENKSLHDIRRLFTCVIHCASSAWARIVDIRGLLGARCMYESTASPWLAAGGRLICIVCQTGCMMRLHEELHDRVAWSGCMKGCKYSTCLILATRHATGWYNRKMSVYTEKKLYQPVGTTGCTNRLYQQLHNVNGVKSLQTNYAVSHFETNSCAISLWSTLSRTSWWTCMTSVTSFNRAWFILFLE